VTVTAVVLGVGLAFLTARTDLPVRRLIGVASVIPLVIPSFLGAFAIVAALAPGGLLTEWFAALGIDGVDLPSPYGFGGAYAALTLFTYPYVLLTVRGALRGIDPALEEASRTLGRGGWTTFRTVTLPQLRPAIGAGGLLVTLYVLSDFGAVTLMRYPTLTQAIYVRLPVLVRPPSGRCAGVAPGRPWPWVCSLSNRVPAGRRRRSFGRRTVLSPAGVVWCRWGVGAGRRWLRV
jgi:iron(III) transport system permease protein